MPSALTVSGLQKAYGSVRALTGVDLEVGEGELVGLLGPNGAGKSTLVKIACGLVTPTVGTATVCGAPAGSVEAHRELGYLAELFRFPDWCSGNELLELHQRLAESDGGALGRAAPGAREPLVQREQLVRRVPAGEAEQLGEVADLPPRVERAGTRAADLGPAAGGPDEPAGDLDQCRFAGAVRAEQADELALLDLEVDPRQRGRRAIALLERADGERCAHFAGGAKNFV